MGSGRVMNTIIFPMLLVVVVIIPLVYGWGQEGHILICRIAQGRLTKVAGEEVRKLLPAYANGDLGRLCPWPDQMRFRYPWASSLHYVNTPDNTCNYQYNRDCKDKNGVNGRCLEGAIKNYTTQLQTYTDKTPRYNLTEALIFLSHFIGDIHQPMHVGFSSDLGGNKINVKWFNKRQNLHRVWDTSIIRRADGSNIDEYTKKIQHTIHSHGAIEVAKWEACGHLQKTCSSVYAEESIKTACEWAYNGVHPGSALKEHYFRTRLPQVEERLAQAGVRLAATLNRIFLK